MGEVKGRRDINNELSKLHSEKVDERSTGLNKLTQIIRDKRQDLKQVNDTGYHTILETVFRVSKLESSNYARATKYTKPKVESRLSACAALVRVVVETGIRKIRHKTVKALVEHVIQTLPTADNGYCEPLCKDYFKALVSLLEFKAHPEHLLEDEWHDAIDFCLEAARDLNRSVDTDNLGLSNGTRGRHASSQLRGQPSRSATPSVVGDSGRVSTFNASQSALYPQLRDSQLEIALCLQHLTSITNAPVFAKANAIVATILDLLISYSRVSSIQHVLFDCINSVMSRAVANDTDLAMEIMRKILPLFRRFWDVKDNTIKEPLLILLFHGELLLPRLLLEDSVTDYKDDLDALIEILRDDYCIRRNREQLQLDDVLLLDPTYRTRAQLPLSTRTIQVRIGNMKAEQPWCLLSTGASVLVALEKNVIDREKAANTGDTDYHPKRRKLTHPVNELLRLMQGHLGAEKLYALQMFVFVLDGLELDENVLQARLDVLLPFLSDDDTTFASWAMLAMNSAAHQRSARSANLSPFWRKVWRLVARHITYSSTCRTACHLMSYILGSELIQIADVADLVDSMTQSIDLNGPAECDDSATTLLAMILAIRDHGKFSSTLDSSGNVLRWLFGRWSPSKTRDRQHSMYIAQHSSAFANVRLICICLGLPLPYPCPQSATNLGLLSQARLRALRDRKLMNYLLLTQDAHQNFGDEFFSWETESVTYKHSHIKFQTLASGVADFFLAEGLALLRGFVSSANETFATMHIDTVHIATSFGILGYALLASPSFQTVGRKDQIENVLNEIRTSLNNYLRSHPNKHELASGFFDSFSILLGSVGRMITQEDLLTNGAILMAQGFDQVFWTECLGSNGSPDANLEPDGMTIDGDFASQRSKSKEETAAMDSTHFELAASTGAGAFRACTAAKIHWMSSLRNPEDIRSNAAQLISSSLQYFTSLPGLEFLLCRNVLIEVLDSGITIAQEDVNTLIQYVAQVLLRPYEYERSEVSMGTTLDILTRLSDLWTTDDGSEVAEMGQDMYLWFIGTALEKGILSPHVHICLSSLLQRIIKIRPDYCKSVKSARTCLFKVLQDGSIVVKFHLANEIPEIFGLFILREHETILEDVLDNLPKDPSWAEGIALRHFALAHLAASWSTLLRRSIYEIIDFAGRLPGSADHAQHCLDHIRHSLKLSNLDELFRLFVPQLLFTWLTEQPLRNFPYSVFGYASLPDLLRDVQDEIVGQVVARGKHNQAAQVAEYLQEPLEDLVTASFSKASAYCIARDVAIPASNTIHFEPHAESRIRNILGKERYVLLVTKNFATVLTDILKAMDPNEEMEKGFQKHSNFSMQYGSYQEILKRSGPDKVLPLIQQPSFKAKYLLEEIDFLCRRTSYDSENLWTPELYVYVFRNVLNSIDPALGPLHACTVLRRVRILISLAGAIALGHYPLEMSLHSLRPYLTNSQCAEEAIGIAQYLLEHGASYLQEAPSFLAGYAVSSLTSMKAFFDSTQDSTTQESQFQATMSRAQSFHAWFASFLAGFNSSRLPDESAKCFKTIVKSASHIQTGGNAKIGTYESELLLELLEDDRSGRNLLDHSCKDTILRFLCSEFEVPSNFRDDILGSDENAVRYASTIWQTCQRDSCSPGFLLWAGRVLGRAYAFSGLTDRQMVSETLQDNLFRPISIQMVTPSSSSRMNVLRLLSDVLRSDQGTKIGQAETTLRAIMTKTVDTEDFVECERFLSPSLTKSLVWRHFYLPETSKNLTAAPTLKESVNFDESMTAVTWIKQLSISLAMIARNDPILSELAYIIQTVDGIAETAFPFILHLVLLQESGGHQSTRNIMSAASQQLFQRSIARGKNLAHAAQLFLQAILYLRTQPLPSESAKADRDQWLNLDYRMAAAAAIGCFMYKTALLFLEIEYSEAVKVSRRASAIKTQEPTDLLLAIYEKIDEQDAFYGVQQPSSLSSMMSRLEYEHAGFKSLSFRGAHYDGQLRLSSGERQSDEESMVRALDNLDLNGLSQSLLSKMTDTGPVAIESILCTARKLEQWDISAPASHSSSASTIFRAFQSINGALDTTALAVSLNTGFGDAMNQLLRSQNAKSSMHLLLSSLAILTEADEIFSSTKSNQLYEVLTKFEGRNEWMRSESFEHVKGIISCRETVFSMLSKKSKLQDILKTTQRDARSLESRSLLSSSRMSRLHGASQNALSTVTYLTELVTPCKMVGIDISAAVHLESAQVLWGQGEMTASIRMLQDLNNHLSLHDQLIQVGKSELLATLGHQISEARLEKPDEIISQYLTPALKELHGLTDGDEAGQVFHEFAAFCDQQLQNVDGLEDFQRVQKLRERKEAEVEDLNKMIKSASSQTRDRDNLKSFRDKAKKWFDLDDREYQRLHQSRQSFLRQSLENYLLCLKACDKYDNDALRFSALWLENYDNEIANGAVAKHVGQVGSRKFAALMNQWSSRLLEAPGHFQTLLASLVLRICVDHPYHGMYQIFAGSKSKGGKDDVALARHAAANNVVYQLKSHKRSSATWMAVHNTNICFVRFATDRLEDASGKPGSKVLLRKLATGQRLEQDVQKQRIPPPTAKIDLRADCNYSDVPLIAKFLPEFSVASGISAPKIVTAIGTDGIKYKQLFKGGNDDLRQDSIMEQVFEQVSNLLRTQRVTRQRNLGIRTYKVLPLTANAGIIEFVQNTIPLHDYLMPAHQRHFPKDAKPSVARKHISDAQNKPVESRIKTFRSVCDHFHPVLRYFFMERFENPDDWFEKRLAYTRSTAAISILGHILGLGDRHGHNILLDNETGEVVHIDLGIAFEQGRILPVPEVVPFRLTRDLVDGMGITKTEGVFRRCCEFTLEALRNESYSIMTILDVLRYDPLYSWSLSPLRLKKMQDAQTEDPKLPGGGGNGPGKGEGEPGEADRALTVVKKKLSKSLSVQATVNELIQMATDERNLAVLYCGWAAYV